jgi:putative flippase GtrA
MSAAQRFSLRSLLQRCCERIDMTGAQIALRYAVFAVIATLANLGAQRIVLATLDMRGELAAAIFVGTGVGLIVKYILDKKWIFYDSSSGVAAHGKRFSLYTAMGVVTTAIFWGFETVFWLVWRTDGMRELGAVIGLAIGYVIKYELDRRFVFTSAQRGRT